MTTKNPLALLNPAGSAAGQVVKSTGATTPPEWADESSPTIPGGKPYFSAYLNANQSVTAATWTKVAFDTVDFDSGSYWDATNKRWNPKVAGKYLVTLKLNLNSTLASAASYFVAIYKNGAAIFNDQITSGLAANQGQSLKITKIVAMNGTTDYIEGWANIPGTGPAVVGAGAVLSSIEALYIGP